MTRDRQRWPEREKAYTQRGQNDDKSTYSVAISPVT